MHSRTSTVADETTRLNSVYEPAEDTWLLIDALEAEAAALVALNITLAVEIGPGSGAVSTALCTLLRSRGASGPFVIGADINPAACHATCTTASVNGVGSRLDTVQCDLALPLRRRLKRQVDVLLFNPPYVPTPHDEVGGAGLTAAWAGGKDGREVIDRFLPLLGELLAPRGVAFLLLVHENKPADVAEVCCSFGLCAATVLSRKAKNERLSVMKISRAAVDHH